MASGAETVTEVLGHDGGRRVTAFVPSRPVEAVVVAADGGWHAERLAAVLAATDGPSTLLVGVHGLDDDGRMAEYVHGVDPERFAAHEAFFTTDVPDWVAARLGVALPPARTAVWGASLGAEHALAVGLRHPTTFGVVLAASPGAGFAPPTRGPERPPRTYLVAGRDEPFFLANATRWADALRAAGADVALEVRPGDHGGAFWYEELPTMVAWALGS